MTTLHQLVNSKLNVIRSLHVISFSRQCFTFILFFESFCSSKDNPSFYSSFPVIRVTLSRLRVVLSHRLQNLWLFVRHKNNWICLSVPQMRQKCLQTRMPYSCFARDTHNEVWRDTKMKITLHFFDHLYDWFCAWRSKVLWIFFSKLILQKRNNIKPNNPFLSEDWQFQTCKNWI